MYKCNTLIMCVAMYLVHNMYCIHSVVQVYYYRITCVLDEVCVDAFLASPTNTLLITEHTGNLAGIKLTALSGS